jgi:hypothetical protein
MGFLFEEDVLPITGKAATSIWEELVDSAAPGAVEAILVSAPLLTKFRRPSPSAALDAAALIRSTADSPLAARGAEIGFAKAEPQLARLGDRG